MFIASIPTRLKWSALQTLGRPLVDYGTDRQWTVNPGISVQFGYILSVCVRIGVSLHVCVYMGSYLGPCSQTVHIVYIADCLYV